ncbi:LRR receptor-like serine/threonine-protein kinase RPK2 [Forsythia ovata]|uniref:LRR receptor-like serine/threonine-protein kinase RPK2 n=1 Tax=Forsythia ovata TaxID=205694 RepID=A0ABD1SJP6_9LAMI
MNLAGNQVNGTIPKFIGGFRDLRGLYLSFNQLGGSIPSEIGGNCGKLEHLELAGNILVEGIPKSIGKCRGLKTLLLYSDMLDEVIPIELGQLRQLEVLDISRNNIGGCILAELGNCSKLSVLVLSNLWDPLPNVSSSRDSFSMGKLEFTTDEFNFYEGTIPAEITILPSLRLVWAPRATLEGQLPGSWGSCGNLEMLNLANNYFSGKFPEGFSNCKKLHFLILSSNRLTGEIFDKIPVPCMTLFDIIGNYLSGSIPKFNNDACAPFQSLRGDPSNFHDSTSAYISYFTHRTQIESTLPLFGDGDSFTMFHNFGSNNLTGTVQSMTIASERLGKQTVYAFFAGRNNLIRSFPGSFFEKCDQVKGMMLNVSNNGLSGEFPPESSTMCNAVSWSGNGFSIQIQKNEIVPTISNLFDKQCNMFPNSGLIRDQSRDHKHRMKNFSNTSSY